ncbi:MAG: hypothetical protein II956_10300 [Bacteroidales bacterium]|nr:hypothetical protein [Bacteroidales bacterium]
MTKKQNKIKQTTQFKIIATNQYSFFKEYNGDYCINEQGDYALVSQKDQTYIESHDNKKKISMNDEKHPKIQYILENQSEKEIVVYKIDKNLIKSLKKGHLKCDYGIYTEDDILFLIELKGSDIAHAIEQIISTIKILIEQRHIKINRVNARIVGSKVPNVRSSKGNINEDELKKYLCKINKKSYEDDRIIQSKTIKESI